ncbi:MAG: 2-oxoacid:acceptor oxidoreductase family protein [Acidobacteria bacterium]|nr:2-oxoacid:acceptor oxidoreductase family protein [Acidobacteriota bacterium]
MDGYVVAHSRPKAFFPVFERKPGDHEHTHYCPGCGHGIIHKLIANAIDELGIQDRSILVSPVGCSVFAYHYFDTGNVQAAHGRAAAVATAAKRACPESIVIGYQGDGDLAAIGTAEIVHAANRGEPFTVFFVNNAIYGMTGGQMAPTTPLETRSTTTPYGRSVENDGYPLRIAEMLATLDAPVYIERVALGNNKQIMAASRAVKQAIENQVKGLGFSLVEILSPCPTVWKLPPVEAQRRVREDLTRVFPLGVYRDRTKEAEPRRPRPVAPPLENVPEILGIRAKNGNGKAPAPARPMDYRIRVGGFGGQGVLLLGEILAEAGMDAGLEVSWLPSYGPEMRSGTSNCHVRLCSDAVDSPVVSRPNVVMALNEPSLRKFLPLLETGGMLFYNGKEVPADCRRPDVDVVAAPFQEMAHELGDVRAGNMILLGAFLAHTGAVAVESVVATLRRMVKDENLFELDRKALYAYAQTR